MPSYNDYVECRVGHNGGYPVLKRLNMSVRVIVELSRQIPNLEELCAALPQCTAEEISAALDYYRDHPQLVDEDIERNHQTWLGDKRATASKWPAWASKFILMKM